MKAFVTLLSTEDYLEAVLVLNESLKLVQSQYPLVCAITEDLKNNIKIRSALKKADIYITVINKLEYSSITQETYKGNPVLNTASKISLFELKRFEKLIYIDADTIILQNIDELMNYPDGAMIVEANHLEEGGFTGLFVFQPNNHTELDFYKKLLKETDCFDGDLLSKLWFFVKASPIHQISRLYCLSYSIYQQFSNKDKVKVVHFVNEKKPWKHLDFFKNFNDNSIILYQKLLQQIKKFIN